MKTRTNTGGIESAHFFEKGSWRWQSMFWPEPKIFLPAIVIIAAFVWWGVHRSLAWYWIVFPSLLVFLLGSSVSWRFTIEPTNGAVREQAFLYGHRLLKERLMPFADFDLVFVDSKGREMQEFRVLLQHKSGRKMLVSCFNGARRGAEEVAWRISCDTGIRMKGETA